MGSSCVALWRLKVVVGFVELMLSNVGVRRGRCRLRCRGWDIGRSAQRCRRAGTDGSATGWFERAARDRPSWKLETITSWNRVLHLARHTRLPEGVSESVPDEGIQAIDPNGAARSAVRTPITATDQLGFGGAADVRRDGANRAAAASGQRLLLTVLEAAHALGVGRSTAYELINAGELEVVHIGRACRIPVAAVEAYVERLRRPRHSTSFAVRPHP